jgi:hypothetical protein
MTRMTPVKMITLLFMLIALTSCSGRDEPHFEHGIAIWGETPCPMIAVINLGRVDCVFTKGLFGVFLRDSDELAWWPAQRNDAGNWIVDIGVPGKHLQIEMETEWSKSGLTLSEKKSIQILDKFVSPDR